MAKTELNLSNTVVRVTDHENSHIESTTTIAGLKVYEYLPTLPTTDMTVTLVHGGMDRGRSFRRLANQLANRGVRVVTYDRRGYGDSLSESYKSLHEAPTFEEHISDLSEVIGKSRGILFGHSIGGTISLAATAKAMVNPLALVTYEAPLPFMEFWRQNGPYAFNREELDLQYAASFAKEFMIRMVGEEVWNRLPPSTRERRIAEGPTLVSEMSTAAHYHSFKPSAITTPTLICCGSIAPKRHLQATQYLASTIESAKAEIIDGADHGIHLSRPSIMAEVLSNLLAKL